MLQLAVAGVVGAIVGGALAGGRRGAYGSTRSDSTAAFGVVIGAILGLVCVGSFSTLPGLASGAGPSDAAGRESRMPTIIDLNASANFDAYIQRATVPVLVDFWAPWCGPCLQQGRILHGLEPRLRGRAVVVKVNVGRHRGLARRFAVRAIPTLVVFENGRLTRRMRGLQSARNLYAALGL